MKNRLTAPAATLMLLASGVFGPARSEEAIPPSLQTNGFTFCTAGPQGGGCERFQGYIYVGRTPGGAPAPVGAAPAPAPTESPTLGDERLYIHLGGADAR